MNKLICNENKTQSILFSLSQNQDNQSVKLLGFHLDPKLKWESHIENLNKRLSRVNFLFWKLKPLVNIDYLKLAYFGLFQSHLQYGLIVWGHSSHIHSTLLLQKKIIRTIAGAGPADHCRPLFVSLGILTLVNLYIYSVLIFTKTNTHEFYTRQDTHEHNTRNKRALDTPHHRLALTGNSFRINCIRFYNKLPESVKSANLSVFKSKITSWLTSNPFYKLNEFLEMRVMIK